MIGANSLEVFEECRDRSADSFQVQLSFLWPSTKFVLGKAY